MTTATPLAPPPLPAPAPLPDASARKPVLGVVLGALGGLAFGYLLAKLAPGALPRARLDVAQKLALIAGTLVALPLTTLVHELGHLAGGALAGLEFGMLIWGPIKLWREGGRLMLGRNRSVALAGGLALSVPRDTSKGNGHAALMVAGGPAASYLLGAGLVVLARAMPQHPVASAVAGLAGITSLGIGLVTLIPMRTSGFLTDGARLLRLMKGGETARRDRALMTLVGLATSPVRPREWPAAVVRDADGDTDGSPMDAAGPVMSYLHALDLGDVAGAHAHLVRAAGRLAAVPPTARGSFATEMAFYELVVRGDAGRARAWLALDHASPFQDRLVRPVLDALLEDGGEARARALLPELADRSGIDRMRAEQVGIMLDGR